jgi:FixJ family two-component response regulator
MNEPVNTPVDAPLVYWSGDQSGHVFIVEDDAAMRESLQRTLFNRGHRVYAYAEPLAFLRDVWRIYPSVLLLDMRLPSMSGVEVQARLRELGMDLPIVFISGESTVNQAVKAMEKGATRFLVKPVSRTDLLAAVDEGLERDRQLQAQRQRQDQRQIRLERLAPREREVLDLLLEGHGNQEISAHMHISYATAKQYKGNVMIKLGVQSMAELMDLMRLPGR